MKRIEKLLKKLDVPGLIVVSLENIRYLTGFTGDAALLYVSRDGSFLITDYRFHGLVEEEVKDVEVVLTRKRYIEEVKKRLKGKEVGFESHRVSYKTYEEWKKLLKVELVPVDSPVEKLRVIKDKEEIELIRKACEIGDRVFQEILDYIKPGVSEKDIAIELEYRMRKLGGEGVSFPPIVASGPNSAIPHARATDKKIKEGELLILDFGTFYKGYASDMTRTVAIGKIDDEKRKIYEVVREAQKKAREEAKPGIKIKELDRIAREYIDDAGYGRYFTHSLGHGVGLCVHEDPHVSLKSKGKLKEGMVITIEPGIYLPGNAGVRIEDTVAITKDGVDILTSSTRELITL